MAAAGRRRQPLPGHGRADRGRPRRHRPSARARPGLHRRPVRAFPPALRERGIACLPQSLAEALDALAASALLREALGATLHAEFLRLKRAEWLEYARHVSDWEHRRYGAAF